jgi:DNA repair protein RecN (Recombination protein N)
MVERLYVKSLLSFEQIELEFSPNLVVLSGPSGAGKSVLMNSVLAGFGLSDGLAQMSEMELALSDGIESDIYELENPSIVKLIKKNSVRCYVDGQSIPRKELRGLLGSYVHYLSVRDKGGFESETLIRLIDDALSASEPEYSQLIGDYRQHYQIYRESIAQLDKIRSDEKELAERIEFTTFEIEKIRSIDPREDELDELMATKRQLSRIEKIDDAAKRAEVIFGAEGAVEELFGLLERDGGYFSDAMNQLRSDMEAGNQLVDELSEMDVETILDRLEQLNTLIKRHGSIEESLNYLTAKEEELAGYTHIEEDKSALEEAISQEEKHLNTTADKITKYRKVHAGKLAETMSRYLLELKLPAVSFRFDSVSLGLLGRDEVDLELSGSMRATLSGGEHNRLRLALMASALLEGSGAQGVVILDEIDANVSGDESIAIAEMISDIAQSYQVFAISHQPHLAAKATQHILITKEGNISQAVELDHERRVGEIARIVGGEMADDEAVAFARKLVEGD